MTNYIVLDAPVRDYTINAPDVETLDDPVTVTNADDTRIARNGDVRIARNGDTRIVHNLTENVHPIVIDANNRDYTINAPDVEAI